MAEDRGFSRIDGIPYFVAGVLCMYFAAILIVRFERHRMRDVVGAQVRADERARVLAEMAAPERAR